MSAGFAPARDSHDPFLDSFRGRRAKALPTIVEKLCRRLPGESARPTAEALARFMELPADARREVFSHPLFHYWWFRLLHLYREGDLPALTAWAPHLARFVAPPSPLRSNVPGTGIQCDATDSWAGEFLAELNRKDPPPGFQEGDCLPAAVTPALLGHLSDVLDLLRRGWPEMGEELDRYVKLIVPYESVQKNSFTNTWWQGAVFLRNQVGGPETTLERLVHEASHLRLNVVMEGDPLHLHAPSETVPSPFRSGPRPINGLYHGAFVFTRAATALQQVFRVTGERSYIQRIPRMLEQVREALALLRTVRLTALGSAILGEIGHQTEVLQDATT